MLHRIVLAFLLSVSLAAAAQAQSFDGVYKGLRRTTKITPYQAGGRLECTPIGRNNPVEFRVVGSTITMRYLDFAHQVTGTLASDGSFALQSLYMQHGGPTAAKVSGTWTGRIVGSELSGTLVARTQIGECHGVFGARK